MRSEESIVDGEVVDAPEQTALERITRGEVSMQVATAKQYPRTISRFLEDATALATLNEDVAASCTYALPRGGKPIEGPSARFAEVVSSTWGHIRAQGRIVDIGKEFVTAQGTAWDMERNNLISVEVKRRITGKDGKRFSDDMIGVTSNAAIAIAVRNARLQVVPRAYWQPVYEAVRRVLRGDATTLAERRTLMMAHFAKIGVLADRVFAAIDVRGIEDITLDHLVTLRATAESIKNGEATIDGAFPEVGTSAGPQIDPLDEFLNGVPDEPAAELRAAVAKSGLNKGQLAAKLTEFKGKHVEFYDWLMSKSKKAPAPKAEVKPASEVVKAAEKVETPDAGSIF